MSPLLWPEAVASQATRRLFAVERYPTLLQMTSTVTAELRPEVNYHDIFRALFPCGSITGAPKVRAMQLLAELEDAPRGVYTGAIGFFSQQQTVFSVAIRTLELANGQVRGICGRQGALMAPTETLAEQHFLTVEAICAELGVRVVLLTGSAGTKRVRAEIASGEAQIVVGTHALIQRDVAFADLAVAVVDEQHRFGVEQRQALAGLAPAPAAHDGDADPADARAHGLRRAGRDRDREAAGEPEADHHAPGSAPSARARPTRGCACTSMPGRQAYVVCPLIEASETRLARAAEEEAERLPGPSCAATASGCFTAG